MVINELTFTNNMIGYKIAVTLNVGMFTYNGILMVGMLRNFHIDIKVYHIVLGTVVQWYLGLN